MSKLEWFFSEYNRFLRMMMIKRQYATRKRVGYMMACLHMLYEVELHCTIIMSNIHNFIIIVDFFAVQLKCLHCL